MQPQTQTQTQDDSTIYEPKKSGGDWRCSNGRCRERLAKAEVTDAPGLTQGYVLTGVRRMIVRPGHATGKCSDCGRLHNLGSIFLALAGEK